MISAPYLRTSTSPLEPSLRRSYFNFDERTCHFVCEPATSFANLQVRLANFTSLSELNFYSRKLSFVEPSPPLYLQLMRLGEVTPVPLQHNQVRSDGDGSGDGAHDRHLVADRNHRLGS